MMMAENLFDPILDPCGRSPIGQVERRMGLNLAPPYPESLTGQSACRNPLTRGQRMYESTTGVRFRSSLAQLASEPTG
jgi:hypothetical protein